MQNFKDSIQQHHRDTVKVTGLLWYGPVKAQNQDEGKNINSLVKTAVVVLSVCRLMLSSFEFSGSV